MTKNPTPTLKPEDVTLLLELLSYDEAVYDNDGSQDERVARLTRVALKLQRARARVTGTYLPSLLGGHEYEQEMTPSQVTEAYVRKLRTN